MSFSSKDLDSLYSHIQKSRSVNREILRYNYPLLSRSLSDTNAEDILQPALTLRERVLLSKIEDRTDIEGNEIHTASAILKVLGMDNVPTLSTEKSKVVIDMTNKYIVSHGMLNRFTGLAVAGIISTVAAFTLPIKSKLLIGILLAIGVPSAAVGAVKSTNAADKTRIKEIGGFKNSLLQKISSEGYVPSFRNTSEGKRHATSEKYTDALIHGAEVGAIAGYGLNAIANVPLLKEVDKVDSYGGHTIEGFVEKAKSIRSKLSDLEHKVRVGDAGPHYMPKINVLNIPGLVNKTPYVTNAGSQNVGIMAHELGHAVDFARSPGSNGALHVVKSLLNNGLTRTGVLVGLTANEKTRDYAVPAYMATYAPTLISEGKANINGYKLMKEISGKSEANRFLKNIVLKNTASYWSAPLAVGAGMYGFKKYLDRKNKKK